MDTEESFSAYEEAFFGKITEFHISAHKISGEGSRHALLHKKEIAPIIRKRDVPLILEGKISSKKELEKELAFAKTL
ncbi:MAG: hypothetical protein ABIF85_04790 [Nanoarchaeota archaeon]|nr:hypothetical protein [Nanoarchaeota archaeon]MBU4299925.1 hypothetical protein [Nanoarchaeota archaeon]MBU4451373.1 hypothetical protein [Nanoarchaeota archaeon]MCG2724580.1 hypothetical protein [archaeon]